MSNVGEIKLGGSVLSAKLSEIPGEDIERQFVENISAATKIAKQEMLRTVRERLSKGISGATYNADYAKIKSIFKGGGYSSAGPVDLNLHGQLTADLRGRGRGSKKRKEMRVWLGFKRQKRRRQLRSPNSGYRKPAHRLTNKELADIFNGENPAAIEKAKLNSRGEKPLALHEDEEERVIDTVLQRLFGSD